MDKLETTRDLRSVAEELRTISKSMAKLRELGVIRSQKLVSDLGEWIVATLLGGSLAGSKTQKGWDVECAGQRVQVRSHAKSENNPNQWSPAPTNPTGCDDLVIVVFSERLQVEQILRVPIAVATQRAKNGRLQWRSIQKFKLRPSDFLAYENLRPLFAEENAV